MRRADRLFRLVQLLRRRRVTTAKQLAEALEVSERSIYRDVRDLIASGVPITGEAGVGYALPKGFDLPPMTFTEEEIEALSLGARVVESWGDERLADAARAVIAKIEAAIPERLRPTIARTPLYAPGFHVPPILGARLVALRTAIATERKVRMIYDRPENEARSVTAERSKRVVWPLGLFFWGNAWTLAAWCELRDGFRNFRLDRIHKIDPLDDAIPNTPGRTLDDFIREMRRQVGERER